MHVRKFVMVATLPPLTLHCNVTQTHSIITFASWTCYMFELPSLWVFATSLVSTSIISPMDVTNSQWLLNKFIVYWMLFVDNGLQCILGLYSLSGRTSYRKISWSLEATRFGFILFQSFWNLTGPSAAVLPRCLSNFRAIRWSNLATSRLREIWR